MDEFRFKTFVSFQARPTRDKDGLRVQFSIPVHADLLPVVGLDKRSITCKARVWKGFRYGLLGAEVEVTGKLVTGPRGGQYLYCTHVQILEGVKIGGNKLPKAITTKLEKLYGTT